MIKLILVGRHGLSYHDALKRARALGKKVFRWNGHSYNTQKRSEGYRPLKVTMAGMHNAPEGKVSEEFTARRNHENAELAKWPMMDVLLGNALRDGTNTKYLVRETRDGRAVAIPLNDASLIYSAYQSTKGRDLTDEEAEAYQKLLDKVNFGMDQVPVSANAIKAGKKDKSGNLQALEGWVPYNGNTETIDRVLYDMTNNPFRGRIFQNEATGEFAIVAPSGEIEFGTDNDKIFTDPYNAPIYRKYWRRKDNLDNWTNIESKDADAEGEVNSHIRNGWNPTTGKYDVSDSELVDAIHNGTGTFAAAASNIMRKPLGLAYSTARLMLPGNNYTAKDWWDEATLNSVKNNSGLGDIVADYMSPGELRDYVRFVGNIGGDIGLTNLATAKTERTGHTYHPEKAGRAKSIYGDKVDIVSHSGDGFRSGKVVTIDHSGPHTQYVGDISAPVTTGTSGGRVTGSTFRYGNTPSEGMGTSLIRSGNSYTVQYGNKVHPISVRGTAPGVGVKITKWNPVVGSTWTPGTPAYWSGSGRAPFALNITYVPTYLTPRSWTPEFQGYEEVGGSPWLRNWALTGESGGSNFSIIPNEFNTSGGSYTWSDPGGNTISSMPGASVYPKQKTSGKPSK